MHRQASKLLRQSLYSDVLIWNSRNTMAKSGQQKDWIDCYRKRLRDSWCKQSNRMFRVSNLLLADSVNLARRDKWVSLQLFCSTFWTWLHWHQNKVSAAWCRLRAVVIVCSSKLYHLIWRELSLVAKYVKPNSAGTDCCSFLRKQASCRIRSRSTSLWRFRSKQWHRRLASSTRRPSRF